jgi:hypothetical protein
MKHIKNLVVTTQGKDKKYYKNIGKLFEREDGSQCILINALGEGIWANFYDPKPYEGKKETNSTSEGIVDDDLSQIPF